MAWWEVETETLNARFGSTYTKIGTIQRRLAWPLRKDDTEIREVFHILKKMKGERNSNKKRDNAKTKQSLEGKVEPQLHLSSAAFLTPVLTLT